MTNNQTISESQQIPLDQAYQLAEQHFNNGNLHQAEILCRQILQALPNYSPALHLLGVIAARTGHHDVAEQLLSRAIAIDSNVLNYHENLVKVYQQQNKSELAVKYWHEVEYPLWINNYDTLTEDNIVYIRSRIQEWESPPQISLLIYVDSYRESGLRATVESIKNQLYPYWEMYIVARASTPPDLRQLWEQQASEDHRIKMAFQELLTTTAAYNYALNLAKGDYLALIDCGDLLPHHALYFIAGTIVAQPEVMLIYSDEDKINEQNQRFEPYFKCAWNPDLFLSQNFVKHLAVYKTELIRNVGGFREGFEEAHDYDIALRAIEQINPTEIQHFPHVLYHQRISDQLSAVKEVPFRILEAAKMAVRDHLNRRGLVAVSVEEAFNCPGQLRVRYPLPPKLPLVSIIIPTYNQAKLLQTCVGSILAKTDYANFEIIMVDNRSDEAETLAYLEYLQTRLLARIIQYPHPFNFAAINNLAVEQARGEFILFLNNDTEVIHEGWLSEMVSQALRPEIGVVGARLWHPNNTLQHAGVVLGVGAPGFAHIAGHAHKWLPRGQGGYFGRAQLLQNFSAVTGACMMLRKSVFMAVDGFNSQDLAVAYNDVDLFEHSG
jgi:glycosyltransferase involved in cell wall biosynthesis